MTETIVLTIIGIGAAIYLGERFLSFIRHTRQEGCTKCGCKKPNHRNAIR